MIMPAMVRIVPRRFDQPDGGDMVRMILAMTEASVQRWNRLIADLSVAVEDDDAECIVTICRALSAG